MPHRVGFRIRTSDRASVAGVAADCAPGDKPERSGFAAEATGIGSMLLLLRKLQSDARSR